MTYKVKSNILFKSMPGLDPDPEAVPDSKNIISDLQHKYIVKYS
jgi:hypothetical protein